MNCALARIINRCIFRQAKTSTILLGSHVMISVVIVTHGEIIFYLQTSIINLTIRGKAKIFGNNISVFTVYLNTLSKSHSSQEPTIAIFRAYWIGNDVAENKCVLNQANIEPFTWKYRRRTQKVSVRTGHNRSSYLNPWTPEHETGLCRDVSCDSNKTNLWPSLN